MNPLSPGEDRLARPRLSDDELDKVLDSILDDLDAVSGIGGSKDWTPPVRSVREVAIDMLLLR